MWKPNWACTICGMLSSRRYSVQRHIMNLHAGFGVVVSYVEYMAGTLAGIYKPNSTLSQSSKRNVKHFDSSHMKNALKFSYSNPFASPIEFDKYPPTSNSPHYDKLDKVIKSSSVSTLDLLTIIKTEFASELGRGLAHNLLYPSQTNTQSFNTVSRNKVSQSSPLYPFATIGADEIFGYRFQICKDCLLIDPLAVCYSGDAKTARIEYKHGCNPILVASNQEGIDKGSSVKTMHEKLPESMIDFVNTWGKGKKALIAIELPKNNNDNTPQETIKVKNPKSRQQLITFQYSKERHIDITLTNENQNHWAIRAIKDRQTTLNDYELTDFVRRVKDRTFAVVKVHMPLSASSSEEEEEQQSIIHIYFMAIISVDDTSSPLSDNDNNNNKTPL
jgi:hypothetical protein